MNPRVAGAALVVGTLAVLAGGAFGAVLLVAAVELVPVDMNLPRDAKDVVKVCPNFLAASFAWAAFMLVERGLVAFCCVGSEDVDC